MIKKTIIFVILGFLILTSLKLGNITNMPILVTSPTSTPSPTPTPPSTFLMDGGYQTFQTFNNCGPSSLSMALSHLGVNISQQILGQELRPYQNPQGDNDDKSVTLQELEAKAKDLGFITYHRPAGNVEIVKSFVSNEIPVIVRTLLHEGEDIGHFRVIKGYTDTHFIQDDSLQGANLEYTFSDFSKLWKPYNFEYLVLVPESKSEIAKSILGKYENERNAWKEALNLAQIAIEANDNDIYSHLNASVAYYHLENYHDSIQEFEKVENQLPFRTLWYQIEPLLSYYEVGNFDKLNSLIDQILSRHNMAFSELHYLKGNMEKAKLFNSSEKEYWKVNLYLE